MDKCETLSEYDQFCRVYFDNYIARKEFDMKILSGTQLKNVLAFYIGYEIRGVENDDEFKKLERGERFCFSKEALIHVDKLLYKMCQNKIYTYEQCKIKVIPILLYHNKQIIKQVIFITIIKRHTCFIDSIGRVYTSYDKKGKFVGFDKWRRERKLPRGYVTFINQFNQFDPSRAYYVREDVLIGPRKIWSIIDDLVFASEASNVVIGVILSIFCPAYLPYSIAVGCVTTFYRSGRAAFHLYDMYAHEESISLTSEEARQQWLIMMSSLISGSLMGVELSMMTLMDPTKIANHTYLRYFVNTMQVFQFGVNALSASNDILYLILNFSQMDLKEKSIVFAQITFSLSSLSLRSYDDLVKTVQRVAVHRSINKLKPDHRTCAHQYRKELGDQQFLTKVKEKCKDISLSEDMAIIALIEESKQKTTTEVAEQISYFECIWQGIKKNVTQKADEVKTKLGENPISYTTSGTPAKVWHYCCKTAQIANGATEICALITRIKINLQEFYHYEPPYNMFSGQHNDDSDVNAVLNQSMMQWNEAIKRVHKMTIPEITAIIRYCQTNVGDLIGPIEIVDCQEDISNIEIICEIRVGIPKFETEADAIYHQIVYSLNGDESNKKQYFDDLHDLLKDRYVRPTIEEDGDKKYFIFERMTEPYGYAVVKYCRPFLSLCTFKKHTLVV